MAVLASIDEARLETLTAEFSGVMLRPGDDGYEEARSTYNGLIDKRPALIARCLNTADVLDAVNLGREQGLEISIRGGGHSVAGKALTDGGLMIDLSLMRGIHVDPVRRTVRAQGGATWNDYNRATATFGLATTGGVMSPTGIAGLTLGGGIGWLMGKHGMAKSRTSSGRYAGAAGTSESLLTWLGFTSAFAGGCARPTGRALRVRGGVALRARRCSGRRRSCEPGSNAHWRRSAAARWPASNSGATTRSAPGSGWRAPRPSASG